jgi:solute carrier family 40 (iron-regulated transporter), member 1
MYLTHVLHYPLSRTPNSPAFTAYPVATLVLFFCLASSRLGRGIFSLTTQQLAQSRLPPHQRSSFAGTETAFVSIFGLAHSLGTAIWSEPAEFGWLAFASWIMVAASAVIYVWWWMKETAKVRHWEGWRLGQYSSLSTNE